MERNGTARSTTSRLGQLQLRYGWGYESSDFAFYDMKDRPVDEATAYLGYRWFRYKLRPALNSKWARSVTEDKWMFSRIIDSLGFPAPQTLGLYDRTYGTTWDLARPLRTVPDLLAELDCLRPRGVVIKPNGGQEGQRVLVLDSIDHDSGRAEIRGGAETTLERALDGIDVDVRVGGYQGWIVQELVRNHPFFDDLAPYATNTLRIQTLLENDGEVHILGAALRLARKGSMVDNVSQGGIASKVDRRTGVTGRAFDKFGVRFDQHPDSGQELAGRQVPHWDEIVGLVRRGAGCFTGLRSLGWDIVITPTGPVILEANHDFALQILQTETDGFLVDDEFRQWMADLGAPLPTGNVVQGFVGRWVWPVMTRLQK